jgi:cysteine synthase A
VTAVMPESMSRERRQLMEMYGAEIILTPADEWIPGSIARVEGMRQKDPRVWVPHQFSNPDNVECHQATTGPEIISQAGEVDAFIAGVGTGGTLMGVGRVLKGISKKTRLIAVEPVESAVLSGGKPGSHLIQGIGPGFIPEIVDVDLIDETVTVSSEEAVAMKERLAREEGLFVGYSSGAVVAAALKIAPELGRGARIAFVLADSGDRYLSLSS